MNKPLPVILGAAVLGAAIVAALFGGLTGGFGPEDKAATPPVQTVQTAQDSAPACPLWQEVPAPLVTLRLGVAPGLGRADPLLTIPESYIPPRSLARFRRGALDGAALIYARLPDFAPPPPDAGTGPQGAAPQTVSVLVTTLVPMEALLQSGVAIWGRPAEGQSFAHLSVAHGLTKVDYPIYGPDGFEMFYAGPSGQAEQAGQSEQAEQAEQAGQAGQSGQAEQITDVFRCDTRPEGSSCSHSFSGALADVQLGYDRAHLHQWREIRAGAEALMGCVLHPAD